MSDRMADDDYEDGPLVEADLDDDAAYEEWAAHPLAAYLTELVMAHIEARESDGIPVVALIQPDSGVVDFLASDELKRARLDRWIAGEKVRGTGLRGRTLAVPKPTRAQFHDMQSEVRVRRKRTSRPVLPTKRTSRPDHAIKRGKEE